MIYTKADLKNIQITKEKLKDRKAVIEQVEPILIEKITRQLKKLFSIIKLNGDKIDTTYFDSIIENKYSHIPYQLDSYYDERGIEIIEEVKLNKEKVKSKEDHFNEENRNDFPYKNYLKSFVKLPLDKQITELFSIYQVIFYGQEKETMDEDDLEEYALEYADLMRSLVLLGWPVYEGMHMLSQAVLSLFNNQTKMVEHSKKMPLDEKDLLTSYLYFAQDIEDSLFSYCYLSDELEDQTVYSMHQVMVENFRLTAEQYYHFQKEQDKDSQSESKQEFESMLHELIYQFSRLVKENRLDIMQTFRARLLFYKEVLELQNTYNTFYPYTVKDEWGDTSIREIQVFSQEDHLESISYFQMLVDYFYAVNEAINTYAKRKYVVRKTTILNEEDVLTMIKEFHLDELSMYDYFDEYGKDTLLDNSCYTEDFDLHCVS